jgi:hypothetical protein
LRGKRRRPFSMEGWRKFRDQRRRIVTLLPGVFLEIHTFSTYSQPYCNRFPLYFIEIDIYQ